MVATFRDDVVVVKDSSELTEEDDIECTIDDDSFDKSLNLDESSNS